MIEWSGVFHIMATPFTDGGDLDSNGLPRLVEAALATQRHRPLKMIDGSTDIRVDIEPAPVGHGSTSALAAILRMKTSVHQDFGLTSGFRPRSVHACSAKRCH